MSRIFTQTSLQGRSISELQALYESVQQELTMSEAGSQDRSNALTSLEAISIALARRYCAGPRL